MRRCSGSSYNLNFRIFDLYAAVSNFAVNFAHNSRVLFIFLLLILFIPSLDYIITFVGWFVVDQLRVWWFLLLIILFYCVFCFYICCRQTNHIRSMMSLTNLGLTLEPLARTIFALFIFVLTSLLLVFWGMKFLHQQDSSPKVVDSLYYFGAQIPDFHSKF